MRTYSRCAMALLTLSCRRTTQPAMEKQTTPTPSRWFSQRALGTFPMKPHHHPSLPSLPLLPPQAINDSYIARMPVLLRAGRTFLVRKPSVLAQHLV